MITCKVDGTIDEECMVEYCVHGTHTIVVSSHRDTAMSVGDVHECRVQCTGIEPDEGQWALGRVTVLYYWHKRMSRLLFKHCAQSVALLPSSFLDTSSQSVITDHVRCGEHLVDRKPSVYCSRSAYLI